MRYDIPIFFQHVTQGEYDTNTGNYNADIVEEVQVYASVTDCSIQTLKLVYGEIKQGCLKIQLQNHYSKPFDRIRVNEKVYAVDHQRNLRTKQVFVVHEVQ